MKIFHCQTKMEKRGVGEMAERNIIIMQTEMWAATGDGNRSVAKD